MAAAVGGLLYRISNVHETADDTFIFLRYAKNFIEGRGLAYNPGERVEGYTGVVWLMLVSALMKLGVEPLYATRALGSVFGAATLVCVTGFSRSVFGDRVPWFLHAAPAALLVSYGYYAYWCAQGLETPLFGLLALLGAWSYVNEGRGGRPWLSPVFFGLSALTRPEGMLVFGLTLAHRFIASRLNRRPLKDDVLWAVPFIVIVLPYLAWRQWYYGYLLPNTYYAKTEFDAVQFTFGLTYLKDMAHSLGTCCGIIIAALTAPLFITSARRERPAGYGYLFMVAAAWLAYVVVIGGDIQHNYRFFMHMAPVIFFALYCAITGLCQSAARFVRTHAPGINAGPVAAGLSALVIFTLLGYNLARATGDYDKRGLMVEFWAEVGGWIKVNTPPGSVIAVTAAGATPYYAERVTIDMLGLNDEYIAHHPEYTAGATPQERKYNSRYVLSRKPDYIVFRFSDWPRANCEMDLFNREEFRLNYSPMNIHTRLGVYAIYARVKDERRWRHGCGYTAGLGESYGYGARNAFFTGGREFPDMTLRLTGISPGTVNHYKAAVFYYQRGRSDIAARELEVEERLNPGFAPSYLLLGNICEKMGRAADKQSQHEMFDRLNTIRIRDMDEFENTLNIPI